MLVKAALLRQALPGTEKERVHALRKAIIGSFLLSSSGGTERDNHSRIDAFRLS